MGIAVGAQDSTKITISTVYKDVREALSELGKGLKVGSEKVWSVLVVQQKVEAITWLIIDVLLITLLIICTTKTLKWMARLQTPDDEWHKDYIEEHPQIIVGIILSIVLLIISLVIVFGTMSNIVTGFINPEYGALERIMEMIKK